MLPNRSSREAARTSGRVSLLGQLLLTAGVAVLLVGLWLAVSASLSDAPTADLGRPLLGFILIVVGVGMGVWGWKLAPGLATREPIGEPMRPGRAVEARVIDSPPRKSLPLTPEIQHDCGAWNKAGAQVCRGCGADLVTG